MVEWTGVVEWNGRMKGSRCLLGVHGPLKAAPQPSPLAL